MERRVRSFLKKLKMGAPYNPASPLLGTCPKNTTIPKDSWAPVVTGILFTKARMWKQPKRPSADKWEIRCGAYVQRNIPPPGKEGRCVICADVDGPRACHAE